jgi:predicted MFS family arabinose efflux permease
LSASRWLRSSRTGNSRSLGAVMLVSSIAPLSGAMILVVLPAVQRDLRVNSTAAGLLVAGYLLVMAIVQPLGGRLGDAGGRGRALSLGLGLIIGASVLGAVAPSYSMLLLARFVQAAGGGLAFPNALAVVRERLPNGQLGRAMGMVGGIMVLSGALAVPLAAGLQAVGTWRAVFAVSAVQGLGAAIAIRGRVPRDALRVRRSMATGGRPGRVVRGPQMIAIAAIMGTNVAMYAFLVGVSLNLGHASRSTEGSAAFLLAFFVGSLFGAPLGGQASDRIGRWRVASVGLGAFAIGAVPLAVTGSSSWLIIAALGSLVGGAGAGAAGGALQASTLDGIPASHAGRVSGLASTARYLGAAIGSTVASVGTGHRLLGVCVGLAFVPLAAAVAAGTARSVRPTRSWEHATVAKRAPVARAV